METAAWLILFLDHYGNCRVVETNTRLWFLEHFSVTLSPSMTKADVTNCFSSDGSPTEKRRSPGRVGFCPFFQVHLVRFLPNGRQTSACGGMEAHPICSIASVMRTSSKSTTLFSSPASCEDNVGARTSAFFFLPQMTFLQQGGQTRTGWSKISASN